MNYRKLIKSKKQLRQLTEMLKWANASDSDESDRPSAFASQGGLYGHISNAIHEIILREAGVERDAMPPVNYGGNVSWFDDFMDAVDQAKYTFEVRRKGDRQ